MCFNQPQFDLYLFMNNIDLGVLHICKQLLTISNTLWSVYWGHMHIINTHNTACNVNTILRLKLTT